MKLLVQNLGEAPIEAYTLLGASMSRNEAGSIGQFGSGAKLAICALLRKGLAVTIYSGLTRMEFLTKEIAIDDGLTIKTEEQVYIQFGGTSRRKQELGWVLGFGELDWKDESMALREFVSNAIDRTVKGGLTVDEGTRRGDLVVDVVSDTQVKAQAGHTKVYVEANDNCILFLSQLKKRFLHFSRDDLTKRILPKTDRNITKDSKKAVIYLEGVFVCELNNSADSVADYNFTKKQLQIDESRNLNEYVVRASIGELYRDATATDLARVFRVLQEGTACLETGLDKYYLTPVWGGASDTQKTTWKEAWEKVNGDAVACSSDDKDQAEFARRKGHKTTTIGESSWMEALSEYGIPVLSDVLDSNEREGRVITAPTQAAMDAVKQVWEWVEGTDLTDKPCPKVMGFDELMNGESECTGFYALGGDVIHLRNDGGGQRLLQTAAHEIGHYVTQATDNSRDFQDFFIRLLVRWLA